MTATGQPTSERYGARVWRAFKRTPRAILSFWVVVVLAALALGADLIANDKPYYIRVDGQSYFPIARSFAVGMGLAAWPQELRNADFYELNQRAESAVWPPIPYSPTRIDIRSQPFASPSGAHWFGTDHLGRDIAAGMLHGTRISLTIGLVVVAIQASIGIALGGLAGYYGGWVDLVISRLIELMLGIPTLFLLITIAAIFPPSLYTIMAVLGFLGWTGIARYVRSEFLRVRSQDFVVAARSLGGSDVRVMLHHVLPNSLAPVLVAMSFGVASAILAESGLSFLGIGVPAHVVTWGSILSAARANTFAWWLAIFPGAAIFLTVTVYNLMGDGLRDALDPKVVQDPTREEAALASPLAVPPPAGGSAATT